MEAKIIQIGNSRGIRLPKKLIAKYGLTESVDIKELNGGLFIAPTGSQQLSWEETYKDMSSTDEDWSDWVGLYLEGLDEDRYIRRLLGQS